MPITMKQLSLGVIVLIVIIAAESVYAEEFSTEAGARIESSWQHYWEASVHTGYGFLDNNARAGVDNGPLLALSISRFFAPRFSLSFEVERIFSDIDGLPPAVNNNFELNTASLLGRVYTDEYSGLRAFGLLAIGLTDHSGVNSESSNLSFGFGGGVRYQWSERFSSRLQLIYRRDTDTIAPGQRSSDIVLTTGLNYRFGN